MTNTSFGYGPCYARFNEGDGQLIVGNALFERKWRIDECGRLFSTSLFDKTAGREWLREPGVTPAPTPVSAIPDEKRSVALTGEIGRVHASETESLLAVLTASGENVTLTYRLQLFPGASGATLTLAVSGVTALESKNPEILLIEAAATGIEIADAARQPSIAAEGFDYQEQLSLAPWHLRLIPVTFHDRTDEHNEVVHEGDWLLLNPEKTLRLSGILFIVEDTLSGDGLIFLKAAPLPYARPVGSSHDFEASGSSRRYALLGHGVAPEDSEFGYPWVTLVYSGGYAGRTAALHRYQRQVRPYDSSRDGQFLSNTWGDRNRDGRVNAAFLSEEIEAGARLGVDVVQIDDGWQKGTTSNSVVSGGVWEGFYAAEQEFWQPHPERFPDGLAALVDHARQKGMRFGLWFAPDSAGDFAHWRVDADRLLDLHRTHKVDYFKIDGVKLRTKTGERNLRAFFDHVLEESQGRVVFDTDVTAETRPAYFGLMDAGPLFVENRYTDFRRYWPHSTLRNLWRLARYVDPVRLRMEWLNHSRNNEKYGDDPLAPAAYRPDYLFATVMFSSPLGWFEVSQLPQSYVQEAGPLITVWKQHREEIFSGTILPIGDVPDGTSWTGFASLAADRKSAFVLIFRELNNVKVRNIALAAFTGNGDSLIVGETLGGDGQVGMVGDSLIVSIPERQRFVFARLTLP